MEKVEIRVLDDFKSVESSTRLTPVVLEPLTKKARRGEEVRLRLAFSITGGLRDVFTPETWRIAYNRNDMLLALRYAVSVFRSSVLGRRRVLGPRKLQKEARLYWTRDPTRKERVWVIVVDEDENVYRPATPDEAKQLLFDFERELGFPSSKLASGENRLWAQVSLWWARHVYAEKGTRKARSQEAVIVVE